MIDDRFYRYDAAHEYDEKIRRSADAYLENLESRASVDSKMRVWCNVFLKANVTAGREENGNDGGETTSRGQEPRGPRPSAYLADADLDVPPVLGTALDTVMGFKERTGQQDVLQRAAVMLIGARMGEAVAQSADPATLDLAITMLGYGDGGGWSSFQNTFLLTAMADDTLRVGWIDALGRVPQNIDEYLRSFVTEAESSGIQQEVEECRHSRNPYRVWSERPQELMTYDDTFLRLRLLEMLDITAWTQALDQLPHPSLINSALLFSNVRRDREAIAASLGIAKLIFDEEGGWNHNIAVLFLTKTILTHASDLHSHLRECAQIQDRDPTRRQEIDQQIQEVHSSLPEWFRKAFGVLVKRPDGEEIAIEFLAELIDRFSREKVKMQSEEGASEAKTLEPWSPTYAALEALGGVLREHGASIDDFRRVWENHEQSYMGRQEPLGDQEQKDNLETGVQVLMADGLPFLLGAILHVENSDPQPESEAESEMATKLWSWFEQLLVGRDPALQALANPYSEIQPWIPFTLGRVLAWLPDPAGAWRESWSALDSHRMRLLHHQYLNDFNADDASQILVHAGLGFIDNFIDNVAISGGVPAAEMVWRSCFNGIRWFWLTHTIDVNKMWEALLLACIARLPRLFHKDSGSIGIEVLRFVSNDPYLVVSAASLMKSNGLNLSVLKESLSGAEIDVPMVIREAESWCDSAGRPKRWDDEFLRNLGPAGQ